MVACLAERRVRLTGDASRSEKAAVSFEDHDGNPIYVCESPTSVLLPLDEVSSTAR